MLKKSHEKWPPGGDGSNMVKTDTNAIRLPRMMNSARLTWGEKKKANKIPEQDSGTLHLLWVVIRFIKYFGGRGEALESNVNRDKLVLVLETWSWLIRDVFKQETMPCFSSNATDWMQDLTVWIWIPPLLLTGGVTSCKRLTLCPISSTTKYEEE